MQSPIKVLAIAGFERSGSTIALNLAGQMDGFFAAGELRNFWFRCLVANKPCGCGLALGDCDLWRRVRGALGAHGTEARGREMMADARAIRTRQVWRAWLFGGRGLKAREDFRRYRDGLGQLYRAIADTTGCRVIVDSSKAPLYFWCLASLPEIELSVVHLVRDPRGVIHSLLVRRRTGDARYRHYGLVRSTVAWTAWNLAIERTLGRGARSARLRYEDAMADPAGFVALAQALTGEDGGDLGAMLLADGTVELRPTHTVGGSPHRFNHGSVALRVDDRWRRDASWLERAVVGALTGPMRRRYSSP